MSLFSSHTDARFSVRAFIALPPSWAVLRVHKVPKLLSALVDSCRFLLRPISRRDFGRRKIRRALDLLACGAEHTASPSLANGCASVSESAGSRLAGPDECSHGPILHGPNAAGRARYAE